MEKIPKTNRESNYQQTMILNGNLLKINMVKNKIKTLKISGYVFFLAVLIYSTITLNSELEGFETFDEVRFTSKEGGGVTIGSTGGELQFCKTDGECLSLMTKLKETFNQIRLFQGALIGFTIFMIVFQVRSKS